MKHQDAQEQQAATAECQRAFRKKQAQEIVQMKEQLAFLQTEQNNLIKERNNLLRLVDSLQIQERELLRQQAIFEKEMKKKMSEFIVQVKNEQKVWQEKCDALREQQQVDSIIVDNLVALIKALPFTSPLCRPLLCEVTRGLIYKQIIKRFNMTDCTLWRVMSDHKLPFGKSLLFIKYRPGTK